jgi:hypothetical protein
MTAESDVAGDDRSFARRFFAKVTQAGAVGCATLAICAVLFLMAVDPSQMRCAPWIMPVARGASAPAWMLAPMVALWVVSLCFGAARWGWFARQRARTAHRPRARSDDALTIDVGWRLVLFMAACALLCATPILIAFGICH